MTLSLKRVLLIGLLSHVLAFSTMFTILSGLMLGGTAYILCFFLTALALAGVMYGSTRADGERTRAGLLLIGAVVLLVGLGSLFLLNPPDDGLAFLQEVFFAMLGFFLLRRMVMMLQDIKYVRQSLLEQYRNDIVLIVLFSLVLVLLIGSDPTWQKKMLPFFASFLLTRMVALSLASQLTQQKNMRKSLIEKFQQRTPFFLIAGGLMLIWILEVIGGPIWGYIVRLVTPVFSGLMYAATQLQVATSVPDWLKWIVAKIALFLNWLICWIAGGLCEDKRQVLGAASDQHADTLPPTQTASWLWLKILVSVLIAAGLLVYLYKEMKRASRLRIQEGAVEIREFIHRELSKEASRPRLAKSPLSPMRKTYRKFLFAMQKAGFVRREGETAHELIGKVAATRPELYPEMDELTEYYMRERYGNQSVDEKLPRADQLAQELTDQHGTRKK